MSKNFKATVLERAVGRKLKAWRDGCDLSLAEAGVRVGFSAAKLSLMENAMQPSAPLDIMALGYVYKIPTPAWQHVVHQAHHAETLRHTRSRENQIFDPAEDFPLLLAEAALLRTFTTDGVPSIFQLTDYTAAKAHRDNPLNAAAVARLQETWASRAAVEDPIKVEAVFPEAVLHQVVGGQRLLKAQLLHLMEVSALPDVSLRVVRHSAGAYPAMGCPFTWLSFSHHQHDDVVYMETFLRSDYFESSDQLKEVASRFSALWALALDESASLELIAEAAAI
ncbi:helix-turn-helix transcriptional regulator [Lentzea sp. HUAS12]|uniref:helix-turn-helix domain-containing protein n=1 Tax=Lentzea sp. HUAS12 TaxID=2951806 RepID=UPI0020A097CC|nr:helix-turn-helix transcriptional regulator [Lentzea sp. HUAS12]USX56454.1 helix-turn-helix domain-containing protein [Lentzea sp. HUAS12]